MSKAPQGEHQLKMIFWEITSACNLNCGHCRSNYSRKPAPDELNTREVKSVIDKFLKFSRPLVILSGGEPLLREDIFDIASYITRKNIFACMATNGTLLSEQAVKRIKGSGIKMVSVSIDGQNAELHDKAKGLEGAFQKTVEGVKLLNKFKIPFQINTAVSSQKIAEIKSLAGMAKKLKAKEMHMFFMVSTGHARDASCQARGAKFNCESMLEEIISYSTNAKFPIRPICAPFFTRILLQKKVKIDKFVKKRGGVKEVYACAAGRHTLWISSSGEVRPCGYAPISAGNLRQESPKEIWENSGIFRELRDYKNFKGKCAICEFNNICGGGCRARAYSETGDFLNPDPYCVYNPQA